MATSTPPPGCDPNLDSLYYNLCDKSALWGIIVEALAAAGVVFSMILMIALLASLPFIVDRKRRSTVALNAYFLLATMGLFGLSFAFIVGRNFATCTTRRFLFGVLFAGCFACLLMQCVNHNILARRNHGPRGWALCLGALGLWLVEVVINTEWMVFTLVSYPQGALNATQNATAPCDISNQDTVMALIYVMALILASLVASLAIMAGKHKQWKKEGALLFLTSFLSVCVWVAWTAMYLYGNPKTGGASWDDPTLAITLVANGWVFLILHTIPYICCWTGRDSQEGMGDDIYANQAIGYETILKQQSSQNMFVENKAFSMDEPNHGDNPVSPYSGYSGQSRSSVYRLTELALIRGEAGNHQTDQTCTSHIPRASVNSPASSGGGSAPSLLSCRSCGAGNLIRQGT